LPYYKKRHLGIHSLSYFSKREFFSFKYCRIILFCNCFALQRDNQESTIAGRNTNKATYKLRVLNFKLTDRDMTLKISSFNLLKGTFVIALVAFFMNGDSNPLFNIVTPSTAFSPSSRIIIPQRYAFSDPSAHLPMTSPSRVPRYYSDGITDENIATRKSSEFSALEERKEEARKAWVDRSILYYSKVMREERRRSLGQVDVSRQDPQEYLVLAKKHYFALRKIKDGKPAHAERIYRRIIDEIVKEEAGAEDDCDHAKLAVTTLLLALHLQREGSNPVNTRQVFLQFFRRVLDSKQECACSAKVLQAYALFEMKQGNSLKSLFLISRAVELDPSLKPILQWKQFRDARHQLENFRMGRGKRDL